jgi:hypothetical protein
MNKIFIKYYEHLYRKILNLPNFLFKPSAIENKQIENFVDFLIDEVGYDSIGEEWIYNYMVYLFKERSEQKTRILEGKKIPVNWVMGKKSYELYKKRGENWLFFNQKFIRQYNIQFLNLNRLETKKTTNFDEELKSKYIKDEFPLHLCDGVFVYDDYSDSCKSCKDKDDCKIINS